MKYDILKILKDRYFLREEKTWDDVSERVGKIYEPMYEYIRDMYFIPSSPTLMNACTNGERKGTLSSCFPMGIEDSIEGIFDSIKEVALVTKCGGGVGIDASVLRSSKETIKTLDAKSSGPLPFMEVFNSTLDSIQQGGKRRGAGGVTFRVYHPDILDYIRYKKDLTKMNRFNLSVKLDHAFYRNLKNEPDKKFEVQNVIDGKYNILKDENGEEYTYKKLWEEIIELAWRSGEPGICNESIAIERSPLKHLSDRAYQNPCAEFITLLPYTSCNLGSINLYKFVKQDDKDKYFFDWDLYGKLIDKATVFLNKVIDKNEFVLEKIKETTHNIRPIGIGVMGLAHVFFRLGMKYGDEQSTKFTDEVIKYLTLRSVKKSIEMAESKGAYKLFDYSTYIDANERFFIEDTFRDIDIKQMKVDLKKYGVYNSGTSSIAPTGTLSTIAEVSGGIEPVFALAYTRKVEKANKQYDLIYVTDFLFEEYLDTNHKENKEKILKYVSEHKGSCQGCDLIPREIQKIYSTAADLQVENHLNILEFTSKNVQFSASKTINLPNSATIEDVSNVYIEAYKRKIIGVTCYRDGSRNGILTTGNVKIEEKIHRYAPPDRPTNLPCDIFERMADKKKHIVLVGFLNNTIYELFVTEDSKNKIDLERHKKGIIRKRGKDTYDLITEEDGTEKILIENVGELFDKMDLGLSRMVSLCLRSGTELKEICKQLDKSSNISGMKKAVMRVLKEYISDGEGSGIKCPKCGEEMYYEEGCKKCHCGHSGCT
jgi:ribonucleoside-diphosphate reductase alpha chain